MSRAREIAVATKREDYRLERWTPWGAKRWLPGLYLASLLVLLAACGGSSAPGAGDELTGLASRVVSFSLVDGGSGEPLAAYDPLPDGAVIDPSSLPAGLLGVRANTDPQEVGGVRFEVNGREETAAAAPYLLLGTWPAGDYRLTATPYSRAGTSGAAGSVRFAVSGAAERSSLAFDDDAVFYSPLNWRGDKRFMASSTPGAYLKLRFSGSSLALEFDASHLAGVSGAFASLRVVIDGVVSEHALNADESRVTLAQGLGPGEHLLELYLSSVGERALSAAEAADVLRVMGFQVDAGARLSPAALRPKRLVVFGDAVAEGRRMGSDHRHDAALAYTQSLAAELGAELSVIALAHGYRAEASGDTPLAAAHARFMSDAQAASPVDFAPDYLILAHGQAEFAASAARREVSALLTQARSFAPSAKLFVTVPFSGAARAEVAAGFQAYQAHADADAYLIDLGTEADAILGSHSHDGLHPDETGHRLLGRALGAALRSSLAAPAPRGPLGQLAWQQGRTSPQGVTEAQGVVADGKLYVFGGYTSWEPRCTTRQARAYDPATNSWRNLAPMPEPWTHGDAATDRGSIYLAGGYLNAPNCSDDEVATRTVYRYDIATDSWHNDLPPLPEARGSGGLVLLGSDLHFFGGTDSARNDKGDHWVLALDDPQAWRTLAPLPNPRSHLGAASLDGKIYVLGGQHGYGEDARMQRSVHAYDPSSDRWSELAPLPAPLSHTTAATFVLDGRIVTVAGEREHDTPVADVLAFDPSSNAWSALTPLPSPRRAGVAGVIGGEIIYSGGHNFAVQTYRGRLR